jgi:hypothetical protein
MKQLRFLSVPVLFLLVSCGNPETAMTETLSVPAETLLFPQLAGTWISNGDSSQYIEEWTRVNDSLYSSTGCGLKGTDTLFSEKVQIRAGKTIRQYIPQVTGQNGGEPVVFEITSLSDSSFVAENPAHDFPQRIVYKLKKDSLIAWIEGKTSKGTMHREYFRMARK